MAPAKPHSSPSERPTAHLLILKVPPVRQQSASIPIVCPVPGLYLPGPPSQVEKNDLEPGPKLRTPDIRGEGLRPSSPGDEQRPWDLSDRFESQVASSLPLPAPSRRLDFERPGFGARTEADDAATRASVPKDWQPVLSENLQGHRSQTRSEEVLNQDQAASVKNRINAQQPRWILRLRFSGFLFDDTMAPVKDPNSVHGTIRDVIQHLFDIQMETHGYVPETQALLVDKMTELAQSLSHLQTLTSPTASPNNPVHKIRIAPEIVDYVDDGRNPDIFTRDFVENVQRGNAVMNGKQQAFKSFSEIYAKALKEGIHGVDKQVDMVMAQAGFHQADKAQPGTPNGADLRG